MTTGIYAIVNLLNGRHYVGQAQDISLRWTVHEACLSKGNRLRKNPKAKRKTGSKWNVDTRRIIKALWTPEKRARQALQPQTNLSDARFP